MSLSIIWHISNTNTGPREISPTENFVGFWGKSILHFSDRQLKEEFPDKKNLSLIEQPGPTITLPAGEKK